MEKLHVQNVIFHTWYLVHKTKLILIWFGFIETSILEKFSYLWSEFIIDNQGMNPTALFLAQLISCTITNHYLPAWLSLSALAAASVSVAAL